MYKKLTLEQLREMNKNCTYFQVHDTEMACDNMGKLYRKMKSGFWKEIENKKNHIKGFNVILVSK